MTIYLISDGIKEAIRLELPQGLILKEIESRDSPHIPGYESKTWKRWKDKYPDKKILRIAINNALSSMDETIVREMYHYVFRDKFPKQKKLFKSETSLEEIVEYIVDSFDSFGKEGFFKLLELINDYQTTTGLGIDIIDDIDERYHHMASNMASKKQPNQGRWTNPKLRKSTNQS